MTDLFLGQFVRNKAKVAVMNPQVLAFVGDSVYTLYVRSFLADHYDEKSGKLHQYANEYVKAHGQSNVVAEIESELTEEELVIYKRARNYKTKSVAKNQKVGEYHRATGLEAVVGYLYLTGEYERLTYLLSKVIKEDEK